MDVVNAFNFISCEVIFQKLHVVGDQFIYFSILSTIFMLVNFLCSLVIIPLKENCLLSFHPWACIKVTSLLGPLFALVHFRAL